MEWITDDLPDDPGCYLVLWLPKNRFMRPTEGKYFYEICEFEAGEWVGEIKQAGRSGYDVFAWMPLPSQEGLK